MAVNWVSLFFIFLLFFLIDPIVLLKSETLLDIVEMLLEDPESLLDNELERPFFLDLHLQTFNSSKMIVFITTSTQNGTKQQKVKFNQA